MNVVIGRYLEFSQCTNGDMGSNGDTIMISIPSMSQPHFGQSGRMQLPLPKSEIFKFELSNLCHLVVNNGIKIYLNVLLVA